MALEDSARIPMRSSVKLQGRTRASDELKARCLLRMRTDRAQILNRLRDVAIAPESGGHAVESLRDLAREVIMTEVHGTSSIDACYRTIDCEHRAAFDAQSVTEDFDLDIDTLIALESALLEELEAEKLKWAELEADQLIEEQNDVDAELYEQHLLGGVPCPLCAKGRLFTTRSAGVHDCSGELCCTDCVEMRAALMDEEISMEAVSELLGIAEDQHWRSGCASRARFEITHQFGTPMLFLSCCACGWREVVL